MWDKLREFDDDYSRRIVEMWNGKDGSRVAKDNPLLSATQAIGSTFLGGTPYSMVDEDPVYKYSVHTSGAAKYVAPVVGVTLAGKALLDLTEGMRGQTGELPMEK